MLQLCIVLLVIGVVAILLELLMPGFDSFISGVIGLVALAASAVLALIFVPGGWVFVVIALAVILFGGYVMFMYIRKKQLQGKIILNDTLAEDLPEIDVTSLMGKKGITVSQLRPYGEVDFDGIKVEVSSDGQLIDRGKSVRVIDVRSNKVVVEETKAN